MPITASSTPPSSPSRTSPSSWTTHGANLTLFSCLSRPSHSPPRPALPPELILQILAHPTRWLLIHNVGTLPTNVSEEDRPIITLPPFTAEEVNLVRRIVFRFRSMDQGYSWDRDNHGTYAGSWTWFEAVVKKGRDVGVNSDNSDDGIEDHVKKKFELQRNRHAGSQPEDYAIIFDDGDAWMTQLRSVLREGDILELRACARFGAWVNYVEEAKVEVWCQDDLESWGVAERNGFRRGKSHTD
ncbi:MAG: hypothetical protein Q9166_001563 [cf. Caloplaca sp. 2 TL-2023]